MDFRDKTVLVTGGAGGIGQATAQAFSRAGARVVVADLRGEAAAETARAIEAESGPAIGIGTDVTRADEVEAMVRRSVEAFGRLDIAFNNAGIEGALFRRLADHDEESYDQVMAVNAKGVWLCMREQLRHFLDRGGGGVIVNTASVAGLVGGKMGSPYFASKHAVVGMTRATAIEYAKQNIRINAVCPGVIRTRMLDESLALKPEAEPALVADHPIGRLGQPEEVAQAVLWLASEAASFVTGHALPVDGGLVAK